MAEPPVDSTLTLGDGRRLGCAEFGDPEGTPGFYFHGHPGSRLEAQLADQAAWDLGVRIIALDRPGYGRSDFQRRHRIIGRAGIGEGVALRRLRATRSIVVHVRSLAGC